MRSISSIPIAILLLYLSTGEALPARDVKISKHPVVLVVSYDGFRSDYLNKVKTPTLDTLRSEGVYVPYMQPVFPTKTFPNHQSIATGVYAETHGIVDNFFFDPLYNKTLSGYKDDPGFWNYHPDVLPLWLRNEMAGDDRYSGALMWPGSSQPYGTNNNLLPTYFHPGYDGSVPWENRVNTVISWITNSTKPANLVYLYFDEPDSKGHAFGPNGQTTLDEVAKADNRTAYLVRKLTDAGIYDKVNLIILSDHGMAGVSQERIIHLDNLVDNNLIKAKYGSSPILQFIPAEGKENELYESLEKLSKEGYNFTVWKKGELRQPFYYSNSRRVLDITAVCAPGYAFDDFEVTIQNHNDKWNLTANSTREYGVHGYSNEVASMRPIFMARGPAFRKGFEYKPIRNVDIVPLISNILRIPEPPNNGSLKDVREMIDPKFAPSSSSLQGIDMITILISLLVFAIRSV